MSTMPQSMPTSMEAGLVLAETAIGQNRETERLSARPGPAVTLVPNASAVTFATCTGSSTRSAREAAAHALTGRTSMPATRATAKTNASARTALREHAIDVLHFVAALGQEDLFERRTRILLVDLRHAVVEREVAAFDHAQMVGCILQFAQVVRR